MASITQRLEFPGQSGAKLAADLDVRQAEPAIRLTVTPNCPQRQMT